VGRTSALERFLRYVAIDTRADDSSSACPSTAGQRDLATLLVAELHALGIADAAVDDNGYVVATIPASPDSSSVQRSDSSRTSTPLQR
jgi:tripeptide aminopeptidase